MRIIRFADLAPVAWKNNGGITREIAGRQVDKAIVWRLSLANVDQSGPFSLFTGLTRILTVIDGAGMDLIGASESYAAEPGQPVQFDGALVLHGQLRDGPVRDLNLIYDPQRIKASAASISGGQETLLQASANRSYAFVCMHGSAAVGTQALQWGDTCIAEDQEVKIKLPEKSAGLLITLEQLDDGITN